MPSSGSSRRPLVVLGAGYTGRWIYRLTRDSGRLVTVTSRQPEPHLDFADPSHRVTFDLDRPDTWASIPPGADLLWCFPAEPIERVSAFADAAKLNERRLVVLGSTSAYDICGPHRYPPPWIDETAAVDMTKARVRGEEFLRRECGAIVLRVAGIYGPGRDPLQWLRKGRVAPSPKYVNLIHVEDLAAICLVALERGPAGEVYIVSDGAPRTWESIYREVARHRPFPLLQTTGDKGPGKRLRTEKLAALLAGSPVARRDLFSALEEIEAG